MIYELNFWKEYYAFSVILYLKVLITCALRFVVDFSNAITPGLPIDTHATSNAHALQRARKHSTDCKLLTQHICV